MISVDCLAIVWRTEWSAAAILRRVAPSHVLARKRVIGHRSIPAFANHRIVVIRWPAHRVSQSICTSIMWRAEHTEKTKSAALRM